MRYLSLIEFFSGSIAANIIYYCCIFAWSSRSRVFSENLVVLEYKVICVSCLSFVSAGVHNLKHQSTYPFYIMHISNVKIFCSVCIVYWDYYLQVQCLIYFRMISYTRSVCIVYLNH